MSSNYKEQIKLFHNAIVHKNNIPEFIKNIKTSNHTEFSKENRIAVYLDGYDARLIEATMSDYPATANYIGESKLNDIVSKYVKKTPSLHWDLNKYSIDFHNFLEKHSTNDQFKSIAKLESAICQVFWSEDSDILTADTLKNISEEELGNHTFKLIPAAKLLNLKYAVNNYINEFRNESYPIEIKKEKEFILVIRSTNKVKRILLEETEYELLLEINKGNSFNKALSNVNNQDYLHNNLQNYIARWFETGVFAS